MINLEYLLNEKYGDYSYGCIMVKVDEASSRLLFEFGTKIIDDNILYTDETQKDSFGREKDMHVTVKYGLTQSYTKEQMKHLLKNVVPFNIQVKGISVFENERFDVVKFDIDGKELRALNELFSKLPNQDSHPKYKPHLTLGYVHKGMGKRFIKPVSKFATIPVKILEYSDRGEKTYYNL